MARLAAWLFLAAIVLGVAGLAVTTERASAQTLDLSCDNGGVVDGVGTVTCTLTVTDLPDPLSDFNLTIVATYNDVDGSGDASPGDQVKCIEVSGTAPDGSPIAASFCRPEVPTPPSP